MFLFRGADRAQQTNQEEVAATNEIITVHRRNFDKDVEILAKLCEGLIGPCACSPNLQSLHHMIRKLLDLKGHPTFEMIVERLGSKPYPFLCLLVLFWLLILLLFVVITLSFDCY